MTAPAVSARRCAKAMVASSIMYTALIRNREGHGMKSVVVTGSSTGIGFGAAKVLIEKGFRVLRSVRKEADAARLSQALGANFVPLVFDVTDAAAVNAAAGTVAAALGGETLSG